MKWGRGGHEFAHYCKVVSPFVVLLAALGVLRVCVWPRCGLLAVRGVWYDKS